MHIFIFILILIVLIYFDIVPVRKWYHLYKVRLHGIYTRLKIWLLKQLTS